MADETLCQFLDQQVPELIDGVELLGLLRGRQLFGADQRAGDQDVAMGDQALERRDVRRDHRPQVPGQPGVEADPTLVGAIEEPADGMHRVLRRVQAVAGVHRGHVAAGLAHRQHRPERDLLR